VTDAWLDALDRDPLSLFDHWFSEAVSAGIRAPETAALATATASGVPSARMVLLKGRDGDGFLFFTNRESRKGIELAANPHAALVLYWQPLERQVRIEGRVTPLDDVASAAYYVTRPRGSRLAAWASPQSRAVAGREVLERAVADLDKQHPEEVPLPPFWGGYAVEATALEFWEGRPDRLHDRVRYERDGDGWVRNRLGP
jgi:pyridoxamine 5'-phosphate oxidase